MWRMETLLAPKTAADRRRLRGKLYPVRLILSYTALHVDQVVQRGWGETTEIGSGRLRVKLAEALSPAATGVVMSIAWPVKLADGPSLQLVIRTTPSWDHAGPMEFTIDKHEFRTASRNATGMGLRTSFATGRAAYAHLPAHFGIAAQPAVAASGA
jgi:hypothetical protein